MPRHAILAAVALIIVTTLTAAPGRTTTVEAPTFTELVERADQIFVGEVVAVEPVRTGNSIHTDVTFRVTEMVKGRETLLVRLTFLGGQIGDLALEVAGMPQFTVGDQQVIFAVARQGLMNPIVGFWHGRVRITRDRATGIAHVLRYDETPFARASALTQAPAAVSSGLVMPMTLDAFLADVRRVARGGGAP